MTTTVAEVPSCKGHKVIMTAGRKAGKLVATNCPGCADCAPPASEVARRERAAAAHAEVMLADPQSVEAHRVQPGDALLVGVDDDWHPVLAAFGENAASASPTLWAIYYLIEGEPTRRVTYDPSTQVTIRRKP